MSNPPSNADNPSGIDLSSRTTAIILPVIVTCGLFALAAALGGEAYDRQSLTLVRFISLLMLGLGLYTSVMTGRYCVYSKVRWTVGQVAAGLIGIGAGLVWSAAAFGLGFVFFMTGTFVVVLLMSREFGKDARRRRRALRKTLS